MYEHLQLVALSKVVIRTILKRKVLIISFLAFLFYGQNVAAQSHLVTGTVVSSEGNETIPGVNIIEKGTSNGTVTDHEGKYSISVSEGAVLIYSSIGYVKKEITVGSQTVLDIILDMDVTALSEVVVIGYGTVKKSDLTGAVASVSAEELNSQPITSLEQGLQGRVAGMVVTNNSSAPGGGISVKIRGVTSILNGGEPLYVIDGFPVTGQSQFATDAGRGLDSSTGTDYTVNQNPLSSLNPSDIESIEVLKDASSAAIYGVRGANGVVLITTKRGKTGAPKVSYNGYAGVSTVANEIEVFDAQGYQDIYNLWSNNGGGPDIFTGAPPNDIDWQNKIFQSGIIQNHQLGVNGGTDAIQYNVSGTIFDQEGIIKESGFQRQSLNINLDIKASDKFRFGNSLITSRSLNNAAETEGETTNSITTTAIRQSPILPVYRPDGTYATLDDLPANVPDAQGSLNPVAFLNEFSDEQVITRVLGNVYGEYSILPELKLRVTFGADMENRDRHVYRSSLFQDDQVNQATVSSVNRLSVLNENTLTYTKSFDKHNLTILGGFTNQRETEEFRATTSKDFATDITGPYDLGGGSVAPEVDSRYAEFSILSFLGRVNYNFDDRFLITATARRDGSSKFAEGNKWATFPSIAGAWRISNEEFMKGTSFLDIFDNLKIRAGWGQTGNQELPTYRSLALLQSTPYNFGSGTTVNGFSPLRIAVPNLTWEKTAMTNVGLDVSLVGSRVNFTFDYYVKKTKDLLLEVQLPETSGILDPSVQNLGEMENKGWEFSLNSVIVDNDNLRWDLGFNISGNKNEITSLGSANVVGEGDQSYELPRPTFAGGSPYSYVTVGEPLGVFRGYKTNGLYRTQADVDADGNLRGPNLAPGVIRFVDIDGDGALTVADRTIIGSPHPDFVYGINSSVSFKSFELRVFFQGQSGGEVYNTMAAFNSGVGRGQNLLKARKDSWSESNTNAKYPQLNSNPLPLEGTANTAESDFYLEDASYLRMREITLTYNLPSSFLGGNGSVYITGQNLLTITDYSGYNPDTNGRANVRGAFGWDVSAYPLAKTTIIGVRVNF